MWQVLEEAARVLRAPVLLEAPGGAVIGHAVRSVTVPAAYTESVVRRRIGPIADALLARRSHTTRNGTTVVSGRLSDWAGSVEIRPLSGLWLWLLPPPGCASGVRAWAARIVEGAAQDLRTDPDDPLATALQTDEALPVDFLPPGELVLMAVHGPHPVDTLRVLLSDLELPLRGTIVDERLYLIMSGLAPEQVRKRVQACLPSHATAVLAPARTEQPVRELRRLLDEALTVRPAGLRTATLAECRSELLLARMSVTLPTEPDLGPDPVWTLLQHDSERKTELGRTLLAWLDDFGDVTRAASRLLVHPNTFRYRLGRARNVLGVELDDPAVRLEVHIRLRTALRSDLVVRRMTRRPADLREATS